MMDMEHILVVLGASDPEMSAIAALAAKHGCYLTYANHKGVRVHPGVAYKSDMNVKPLPGQTVVAIECGGHWPHCDPEKVIRIDHHNLGDPGYAVIAKDYLAGSSLGQFMKFLAREIYAYWPNDDPDYAGFVIRENDLVYEIISAATGSAEVVVPNGHFIAAADHCLLAAYRGLCPWVDPEDLLEWRMASRAAFQCRKVADVKKDVEAAMNAIRQAYRLQGHPTITDMTGEIIPELPEAACRLGLPVLAGPLNTPDGRRKVVLQAATAGVVQEFLVDPSDDGLVDKYGSPERGYAGGYLLPRVCARCGAEEFRNSNMASFDFEAKEDGTPDINRPIMGGVGVCGDMHEFGDRYEYGELLSCYRYFQQSDARSS